MTARRGGIRGCWRVCDAMSDTLRLLLQSRVRVLRANPDCVNYCEEDVGKMLR